MNFWWRGIFHVGHAPEPIPVPKMPELPLTWGCVGGICLRSISWMALGRGRKILVCVVAYMSLFGCDGLSVSGGAFARHMSSPTRIILNSARVSISGIP